MGMVWKALLIDLDFFSPSVFSYGLFGSLKKGGIRVEGGRVIQLPCLEVF